ncbi:hypothetical protein ACFO5K_19580 [Nocardia halotolerans]|uniref:Uncharacterized protein n=1 Tax=Nocardia halotolerans TaxID=1755878 RepID=A0ABV8VLL4_9NOCA
MSEPTNIDRHDATLHAELRLFCHLMLGSADATDRAMRSIYRRALDSHDEYENRPSERIRLFRIAAELCRATQGQESSEA